MNAIAERYAGDDVGSIFLYTHESHPGENLPHLTSMAQKLEHARALRDVLGVSRPILVVGLGLGYHVAELVSRGARQVAVLEPDAGVAKLALEAGALGDADVLLGVGDLDAIAATDAFREFSVDHEGGVGCVDQLVLLGKFFEELGQIFLT